MKAYKIFYTFKLIETWNILMCFQIVHIIVTIYQTFYVKVVLNTTLTSQFQTYLLPTFIIQKLLKFCIQLTKNSMEVHMVLHFYLQSFFIYFFMHMEKFASIINCVATLLWPSVGVKPNTWKK